MKKKKVKTIKAENRYLTNQVNMYSAQSFENEQIVQHLIRAIKMHRASSGGYRADVNNQELWASLIWKGKELL